MAGKFTFTMIKPEAVASNNIGAILKMIEENGFVVKALKYHQLDKSAAEKFYAVHSDKPFYSDLTDYMSSGPIVAAVLEKENAITDFRALIGSTDPNEAAEGTIRKAFAKSKTQNAVHGSDSDDNFKLEAEQHFPGVQF